MKTYETVESKNINKLVVVQLRGTALTPREYKECTDTEMFDAMKMRMLAHPTIANGENICFELLGSEDKLNHYLAATDLTLCRDGLTDPLLQDRIGGYRVWDTRGDIFNNTAYYTYYDLKSIFDKIPTENAVILDIRIVATGRDGSRNVVTSYHEAGDISILKKLTELLNDDAYNSIIQAVNNIFNKKSVVLPEVSAIVKDYYNKVSEAVKDKLDNLPVFTSTANINDYNEYMKFDRDLKFYSYEKDLLRCIINAIDETQIRDASTEESRNSIVSNVLYAHNVPHHLWQSYIRSEYNYSGIFDTSTIYLDPNAEFNVNDYLELLKYMSGLYCEYIDTPTDIGRVMDRYGIPCTTTEHVRNRLSNLMYGVLALKTKEFFKSIDLIKEFRDIVDKKLAKHKDPGINMSSCTMENISSFVEARFNRMDILSVILTSCDYYIGIYNKYKDKEFIPVAIASGCASEFMRGLSEVSVFLAKICKYLGNGDMYKGLNPILKEMETCKIRKTVEPNNIPSDFMGSYAGEIVMNDPSRTDIIDVMSKVVMVSELCWRLGNNETASIVNKMIYKKEFLDKVKDAVHQSNTDCTK